MTPLHQYRFCAALILAIISISTARGGAPCVPSQSCLSISGYLESEFFSNERTRTNRVFRRSFELLSTGPEWRMIIRDSDWGSNSIRSRWEIGSDGSTIVEMLIYNTNWVGEQELQIPQKGGTVVKKQIRGPYRHQNNANAELRFGSVPPPTMYDSFASIIWLAYCSGCYFSQSKTSIPPVFYGASSEAFVDLTFPATVTVSSDSPNVPLTITSLNPGVRYLVDPKEQLVQLPLDSPFTNFVYSVAAITNVGEFSVPAQFEVLVFGESTVSIKSSRANVSMLSKTLCRFNTGRIVPKPEVFLPQGVDNTLATDFRVSGTNSKPFAQ
jgi:hypothetical protein